MDTALVCQAAFHFLQTSWAVWLPFGGMIFRRPAVRVVSEFIAETVVFLIKRAIVRGK
ncbi:hypothetical protein L4H06_05825 [Neisseria sp. ZJ104]|uniref:Uncharacterized protein n=1 Tax=Neisseria lisongii TaxID=2912188 RepID=A0AAW5AEK0_9NEIS|nr:hypothetical protein [Neisseria lisongii]MCF7529739.1 hypothetical protein [Neisseria lisongii]